MNPEPPQSGYELPLRYEALASGYVYVQVYSFFDNDLLTIQLWERLLATLNRQRSPGLIIDFPQQWRWQRLSGRPMAAYFFDKPL